MLEELIAELRAENEELKQLIAQKDRALESAENLDKIILLLHRDAGEVTEAPAQDVLVYPDLIGEITTERKHALVLENWDAFCAFIQKHAAVCCTPFRKVTVADSQGNKHTGPAVIVALFSRQEEEEEPDVFSEDSEDIPEDEEYL